MDTNYLEKRTIRNFSMGHVIFTEGDAGHSMFIIIAGHAEISVNKDGKKVIIAHLKPGDIFGEMALFGDQIRSATVVAETDIICHEINRVMFNKQMETLPKTMKTFFSIIVDRLKEANARHGGSDPEDGKRQVVYLLYHFLTHAYEEHLDTRFIYFDTAAEDIAFMSGQKLEKVQKIMTQLANHGLAKQKAGSAHEHVFLVDDMETFKHFAEFCRSRYEAKNKITMNTIVSTDAASQSSRIIDPSEKEILALLKRFVNRIEEDEKIVREDIFLAQLEMQSKKAFHDYQKVMKNIASNGILAFVLDAEKERVIKVDFKRLVDRLTASDRMDRFIDIESNLG